MNNHNYILIKAAFDNYDDYYAIRSEHKNLYWTGYKEPPQYDSFKKWFFERIEDSKRNIYLLYVNKECVGSLHIDFYTNYIAIGYSVKEAFEGNGHATFLVKEAINISHKEKLRNMDCSSVKAWINSQNIGSIKVVEKNGFIKSELTEIRKRFGMNELYYEYDYYLE
ncbi:MAG: GNAT family N-acetyltransferase [Marinilabiliaceae bacterium]|nr:GNAT family N-acetyltransferase [Marinilabiliaceae bacterium]